MLEGKILIRSKMMCNDIQMINVQFQCNKAGQLFFIEKSNNIIKCINV